MLICPKCEPDYEIYEGDTSTFCEKHEPDVPASEAPRPQREETRQGQPGGDYVQGELFNRPTWSSH